MLVYLLTFDNGKHYVGQTKRTLRQRLNEHKAGKFPVSHAMRRHVWRAQILVESEDQQIIDDIERAAISAFAALLKQNGYNAETGGKRGCCSEAVSASNRRRKGLPSGHSPEARARAVAAASDPDVVARRAQAHRGAKRSAEARQRMSEAAKRRCTPEWRQKQSEAARSTMVQDPDTGRILGRRRQI